MRPNGNQPIKNSLLPEIPLWNKAKAGQSNPSGVQGGIGRGIGGPLKLSMPGIKMGGGLGNLRKELEKNTQNILKPPENPPPKKQVTKEETKEEEKEEKKEE